MRNLNEIELTQVNGGDINGKDKMQISKDSLVKYSVIIIIGIVLVLFMVICANFGLAVGSTLGELIYNLKH